MVIKLRYLLFALVLLFSSSSALSDDIIVMKDGDLINARVIEITKTEIKYKKANRPEGPTYSLDKTDVIAINYEDGEKETFADAHIAPENGNAAPKISESPYDTEANRQRVERQNEFYPVYYLDDTKKDADRVLVIFNATPQSVLVDDNVEVSVETGVRIEDVASDYNTIKGFGEFYRVATGNNMRYKIANKTDDIIYIDLQNSFMLRGGLGQSYYVPKSTTTGHSDTSGVGFNLGVVSPILGGITVGGSSTTGKSTTVYSQRVLQIPPHSFIYLEANGIFSDLISCGNYDEMAALNGGFVDRMKGDGWAIKGKLTIAANFTKEEALKRGEVIEFSPEETQTRIGQILTYSKDPEFKAAHVITSEFYMRYMAGFYTGNYSNKALERDQFNQIYPGAENAFTTQVPIITQKNAPTVTIKK